MEDNAQKIEVWEHKPTKRLFKSKESLAEFDKKYQEKKNEHQRQLDIQRNWITMINSPRLQATSIQDFINRVMKIWNELGKNVGYEMVRYEFISLNFVLDYSTGSSCPIGKSSVDDKGNYFRYPAYNGRLNFTRKITDRAKSQKITSYPSLAEFYKGDSHWGIDVPGFHTCGGGSRGSDSSEYDVTFWLEDFPLMYKEFKDGLEDRDAVKAKYEKALQDEKDWQTRRVNYFVSLPEVRKRQAELDKVTTEYNKAQTAMQIINGAMSTHRTEVFKEYEDIDPYDHTLATKYRAQLNYIESELKQKSAT